MVTVPLEEDLVVGLCGQAFTRLLRGMVKEPDHVPDRLVMEVSPVEFSGQMLEDPGDRSPSVLRELTDDDDECAGRGLSNLDAVL